MNRKEYRRHLKRHLTCQWASQANHQICTSCGIEKNDWGFNFTFQFITFALMMMIQLAPGLQETHTYS